MKPEKTLHDEDKATLEIRKRAPSIFFIAHLSTKNVFSIKIHFEIAS